MTQKAAYEFRLRTSVNGRIGPTVIEVFKGEDLVTTDKADMESGKDRAEVAKRLSRTLKRDQGVVKAALDEAWAKEYPRAKAEQKANEEEQARPFTGFSGFAGPPVELNDVPPAARFPTEVLAGDLRQFVKELSWALNAPHDLAGVALLAMAGGAIGNARHLRIGESHFQAGCLYVGIIAPPGGAKSPILKLMRKPFDVEQKRLLDKWQKEMETWKKADKEDRVERPILDRIVVGDTTTESLAITLGENPRGVLMVRDELLALVTSMNQYKAGGKGQDRQVYLSLWAGDTLCIDRKSDRSRDGGPIYVANPFLSIVGGLQPGVIDRLRGERFRGQLPPDDGWLDRFLFCYPDPLPAIGEKWRGLSQAMEQAWERIVKKLLGLEMQVAQDGNNHPRAVGLTADGRMAWKTFTDAHAAEINGPAFPAHLAGPWSKLRGYCGRLALILAFLRWAADGGEEPKNVDAQDVNFAAKLVDYFKSHARRVLCVMDADDRVAGARAILRWIVREKKTQFKRWEAYHDVKSDGRFPSPDSLDRPLELLVQHQVLRVEETQPTGKKGRPSAPVYEVNPAVLRTSPANPVNPEKCQEDDDEDILRDSRDSRDPPVNNNGPWSRKAEGASMPADQ